MRPLFLLIAITLFFNPAYAQKPQHYSRAKIHLDAETHNMKRLSSLGLSVDHGEYKKNTFFISDFSDYELAKARKAGFTVDIIIDDVAKHYQDQNKKKAQKTTTTGCTNPTVPVPSHFHLGSYGGYFTYTELLAIVDSMHLLYPSIIGPKQQIDTFHTIQGRPIYWFRISDNPAVDQPAKPQMLVTALHHAREPGSISATIFYLWYLLENYNSNPQVKAIVDNTELYFVPCVNPDGYIYNITSMPGGGGLWRKNMRNNLDGTMGVDLNRNYGYEWGYDDFGSSPFGSDDTYRGAGPFSEPETQAIKWFSENHHFTLNLNYHTYHNDLLYPWSYIGSFQTVDSTLFFNDGEFLTRYNNYRFGTCNQMLDYLTNGDSNDWQYGETTTKNKVYAWTPEIGLSEYAFYPPDFQIIPDCQNNLMANLNAAALLLPYATIQHTDKKILIQPSGYLHYSLKRLGFPDMDTFTVTITPLDAWMTVSTTPKVYTGLTLFQQVDDSISYSLLPATPNGQLVKYALKLFNGKYSIQDTVQFYYGKNHNITIPSTASLSGWVNSGWDLCSSSYYSPPSSLKSGTTCPGNYPDGATMTISTATPIDLTYATHAYLQFYAKWFIETIYDQGYVNASIEGSGVWTHLCGRYTNTDQFYDGQQHDWVQEEMDLSDYLGTKVNIQFQLQSDPQVNYEGFFVDNINVTSVQDTPLAVKCIGINGPYVRTYPNPAHDKLTIEIIPGNFSNQPLNAVLYDYLGQAVMSFIIDQQKATIDVRQLSPNIYYLKFSGKDEVYPVQKITIVR